MSTSFLVDNLLGKFIVDMNITPCFDRPPTQPIKEFPEVRVVRMLNLKRKSGRPLLKEACEMPLLLGASRYVGENYHTGITNGSPAIDFQPWRTHVLSSEPRCAHSVFQGIFGKGPHARP